MTKIKAVHPGIFLKEYFMDELNISVEKLSNDIQLPITIIISILDGTKHITKDISLRLSIYFNTDVEYWLNLQKQYLSDIESEKE